MAIEKADLARILKVPAPDVSGDLPAPTTPPVKPDLPPEQKKPDVKPVESEKPAELPGDNLGLDLTNVLEDKPPKQPQKTEHPDPEPEPDLNTKDGRAFAAMRKQISELEAKLTLVDTQTKADPAELVELREQLTAKDIETQKLMDEMGALNLERDPRFVAKYKRAEDDVDAQIFETAKELDVAEDVIKEALTLPLKRRIEYLSEEASHAAPTLLTLFSQRDALRRQKLVELSKHQEVREELDKQRGTQELALEHTARARLFDGALVAARETGNFVFQEVPGNEPRNALVAKATQLAKDLFTSSDGERQSKAMMLGVAAPIYLHMMHMERAGRLKAEGELAKRFGKTPSVNGDVSRRSGGGDTTERPKAMSPEAAAKAVTANMTRS